MVSKYQQSPNHKIARFLGKFEFTTNHVKALLRNARMRQSILERTSGKPLDPTDIDNLSSSDFNTLYNAALEAFHDEAPVVERYSVEECEDPYSVEILGVRGAYMVRAAEFDDKGVFATLKEAEACVAFNWEGQAKRT